MSPKGWVVANQFYSLQTILTNCCILHPPKTAHTNCSLTRVTVCHSDPRPNHRRQRPDLLAPVASLSDRQVITCQGLNVHTLKSLQTVCLALVAGRITMSSIPVHNPHSGGRPPPQSPVAHTRRPNCFEEIQLNKCLRDGNPSFTLSQDGYGDCDTARSQATVFEATNWGNRNAHALRARSQSNTGCRVRLGRRAARNKRKLVSQVCIFSQ